MIQILTIHIEEFRGIRNLDLDLRGESFVVHGPNGSGKSGVVDAIGFAFTGTIARLTGAGTGGISVQKHGPHVHHRDDPAAAKVRLSFRDTVSGQTGTIERSVKNAGTFTLTPDTPELRASLELVRQHPELTLSRREIIKFILSEPGARATEVQALLQLQTLDDQRKALKSAVGKLAKDVTSTKGVLEASRQAVSRHLDLDVAALVPSEVGRVINDRRRLLGLAELPEITLDTDLKTGLDAQPGEAGFDKAAAERDIEALRSWIDQPTELREAIGDLSGAVAILGQDAGLLESLKHRDFVEAGQALLAEDAVCPLCDTRWESAEALHAHIREKITSFERAGELARHALEQARRVGPLVVAGRGLIKPVIELSTRMALPDLQIELQRVDEALGGFASQLGNVPSLLAISDDLQAGGISVPDRVVGDLEALAQRIIATPDTSAASQARTYLVVAAERWGTLRAARLAADAAKRDHELGEAIYSAYCDTADTALSDLYHDVEGRFSTFYRKINSDDESAFKAALEPGAGKLDLLVDFYGLGMFPPGAYHSEGHQDGMGVCLYLALVEKLLGSAFRFAVLDDVVMSVDSNHRRQFCELLKSEFPDVQFIITTHDEIWAKQMQSSQLISKRAQARFQGWTVDAGPAAEQGADFWDKIDEDLARDDVASAAHKLRRGLEAELPDLAEELRAKVTYRGDAKYELGELLSAIKGRHSDWLKKAANSANSWGNDEAKARVEGLKAEREKAMLAQQEENWAINALVHFNEWATMSKADFVPVVRAWREFLDLFRCPNDQCVSWIAVTGFPGSEDALRCACGNYHLNLMSKPKA